MRETPHDFVQVGKRWINMALVTDVLDAGDKLYIYLAAPMLARDEGEMETAGRRLVIQDPGELAALKRWMGLND